MGENGRLGELKDILHEKTGLDREATLTLCNLVIGTLLKRLPEEEGLRLLAEFPEAVQNAEIEDISDSDHQVTAEVLLSKVQDRFGKDRPDAITFLRHFWEAIDREIPGEVLSDTLQHLPDDFRKLFKDPYRGRRYIA